MAGEEASWGQWFLGYDPPAGIARLSHQGEMNLHNIVLQGKSEILRAMFGLLGLCAVYLAPRITALASLRAPAILVPWLVVMSVLPLLELAADYFVLFEPIDGFMSSKLFSEFQELLIGGAALVYISRLSPAAWQPSAQLRLARPTRQTEPLVSLLVCWSALTRRLPSPIARHIIFRR